MDAETKCEAQAKASVMATDASFLDLAMKLRTPLEETNGVADEDISWISRNPQGGKGNAY